MIDALTQARIYHTTRTGDLVGREAVLYQLQLRLLKLTALDPERTSIRDAVYNLNVQTNSRQAHFLDWLRYQLNMETDSMLGRHLCMTSPQVSRLRSLRDVIGGSILIRIHETTDIPVRELKARLLLPCAKSFHTKEGQ